MGIAGTVKSLGLVRRIAMRYSLVVESVSGQWFSISSRKTVHSVLAEAGTLPIEYSPKVALLPLGYGVYDEQTQQYVKYPSGVQAFLELN